MDKSSWKQFSQDPTRKTTRIDKWLAGVVPDLSRRKAAEMIVAGQVLVNGKPTKKGDLVTPSCSVDILREPAPSEWTAMPSPQTPLEILFEDEHLVAINKPPGTPSVPNKRDETGTIAGAIAARFPDCATLKRNSGDGGLIHRLDTETSGVILAAKTPKAFESLLTMQTANEIEKKYLALVADHGGSARPTILSKRLETKGTQPVRVHPDGQRAITGIRLVRRLNGYLLVEATIHRGVRHQIRAHLANAGIPIVGDTMYGGSPLPGLGRFFLHAGGMLLKHPITETRLRIEAPLTSDLDRVVESLSK